jgi:chromatin remodeling complex protein RSC6
MSANTSSDLIKMSSAAAKTSTKKSASKTETPAVVAAPAVSAAAAPVAKKTETKAKAVAAPAVAAPVAAAPVATATATAAVEEDIAASLQKSIEDLHTQLSNLKAAASTAANALKTIEKQSARLAKKAGKRTKRVSTGPCVFTVPVKVSDELCTFLGQAKGTEVSRSSVTKGVIAYAKTHNLMDKQTIKADAALRKLLTVNETDKLTILTLQKYLRRHYVKAAEAK